MHFYVMTLFPELIDYNTDSSILGRAKSEGTISVEAVDIRDYSEDEKHHHVDDYPYGGGKGMLMQAAPVVSCFEDIANQLGTKPRVLYMTPKGKTFTQEDAKMLAKEDALVFLCGHYEGIDQRALDLIVTDEYSIGDYVLTGGELPACVMMDAISREIPGVLAEGSMDVETFSDGLLEYPQYTRPEIFRDLEVPKILLSGDHQKVEEWRRKESIKLTFSRRPELLKTTNLSKKEKIFLEELKNSQEDLQNG